jgi:NAD(P)H-nitrite reductase large subunit
MNYCIIGNSIAATAAIEGIRSLDQTGTITVISEEKDPVYGRPLISYWLEEKVQNEQMFYRNPAFYQKHNVKVMLDTKVTRINSRTKTIFFSSGEEMVYDKLLISSGGKPIVPPLAGLTESCYSCFFNYDDVRNIKNRVKAGDQVAVLGGGLTGLKAAESLHRLGVKVSLIELADRLLGTIMDQTGSKIAADFLREKGVDIYLGNTIEKIEPDNNDFQLHLKDQSVLNCSLLVMAIGVSPRVDFLQDSGLKINRGILVDSSQKTSLPEVFAAGDVAEVPDFLTGRTVVAPILPNAFTQGRIAGINMAAGSAQFEGSLAYNAIGFLGLHTVSIGLSNLEAAADLEILEESDPRRHTYRRLIIKDNRLIGAIFIESIGRAGLYQDLIRSRTEISAFKERLLNPDFNLLDLPEEVYLAKLAQ